MRETDLTLAQLADEHQITRGAMRARLRRRGLRATREHVQRLEDRIAHMKPMEAVEFLLGCCEKLGGSLVTLEPHPVDEWSHLTPQERRLAVALWDADGEVVGTEALLSAIYWDTHREAMPDIIKVLICKLRKKLPAGVTIKTHRGKGFSLEK